MLPENYHAHDKKWLLEQILRLPPAYRQKACKSYSSVYAQEQQSNESTARRVANTRLREYVNKVSNAH